MVFTATVLLQRHDEYMLETFSVMQTSKIINKTHMMRLRMKCFNLQLSAQLIIHHVLDGLWPCDKERSPSPERGVVCFHRPAMWPLVRSCMRSGAVCSLIYMKADKWTRCFVCFCDCFIAHHLAWRDTFMMTHFAFTEGMCAVTHRVTKQHGCLGEFSHTQSTSAKNTNV